jgi:hypothetical protein
MKKKSITLIILLTFFILGYIFIANYSFGLRSFFNNNQLQVIKHYIFPYKVISQQKEEILGLEKIIDQIPFSEIEVIYKKSLKDIRIESLEKTELSSGHLFEKKLLLGGFYSGIHSVFPGSGYIDFHDDVLFILSSKGVLAYNENLNNDANFLQIKNNIDEFISLKQFNKNKWFSLKDLLIDQNQIFISYTEEIENDCWNTSIINGKINYEEINFKKLFSSNKCVSKKNNIDKEFNAHQSGGRIINFDKNHILLTTGDYRERHLAQNEDSINGKILKINILDSSFEIISMGHRNPQGLYFDRQNKFILETEHGPMGGDEINLISIDEVNKGNTLNYGWAISSAGEHYGGKMKDNKNKYKKYPLYNSHSKYGFIEPLKSFVPSIGISEISKIENNTYVASSLKDKSLYFFNLDKKKEIINLKRVEISERIRDLKFKNDKLYLFLEDSPSIGIVELN